MSFVNNYLLSMCHVPGAVLGNRGTDKYVIFPKKLQPREGH